MVTVTVCVGSSCHIKGARPLIESLNALIEKTPLAVKIELKGSFCMERCGEGINWQINDEPISSPSVQSAIETFKKRITGSAAQKNENGK